jgi:6-phosphogluconolactonase
MINMKSLHYSRLLLCGCLAWLILINNCLAAPSGEAKSELVFVGTKAKGIFSYRMDLESGAITPLGKAVELTIPGFLAVHPNRKFLYTVNAAKFPDKSGGVSALSIEAGTGKLTILNQESSGGAGPTHLTTDVAGKALLVANYGSGSVAAFPIGNNGSLGTRTAFIQHEGSSINPQRQAGPHAHFIATDPGNHFALACDLGLDKVLIYKLDSKTGGLVPHDPAFVTLKPGTGPRHLAFHPDGRYVYVINELNSTMTAFSWEGKRGKLAELQTISTIPAGYTNKNFCAEVAVHPSGGFVYGSNRGHDSIAVFAIDKQTGRLTAVEQHSCGGKIPRHFEIDPTGRYLLTANQDSGNVVVFRIDPRTGKLEPTGAVIELESPTCVKCVPLE